MDFLSCLDRKADWRPLPRPAEDAPPLAPLPLPRRPPGVVDGGGGVDGGDGRCLLGHALAACLVSCALVRNLRGHFRQAKLCGARECLQKCHINTATGALLLHLYYAGTLLLLSKKAIHLLKPLFLTVIKRLSWVQQDTHQTVCFVYGQTGYSL